MASILPRLTNLGDVKELTPVNQTFTAKLDAEEELISIKITSHDENKGITVSGDTFSGQYEDVFILNNALKYRQGDTLKTANSFSELPNGVDVYEFTPPMSLTRTYNYTVTMVYEKGPKTEPITVYKTYTQTLYGDWSIWAEQLRNYIRNNYACYEL